MEKEDMTTATLTHRIPKESLTVKPTITFSEAAKKVNALVEAGAYIKDAAERVYQANTVLMLRSLNGNTTYSSAAGLYGAIHSLKMRLHKRAKAKREAKKNGMVETKAPIAAKKPSVAPSSISDNLISALNMMNKLSEKERSIVLAAFN